MPTTMYKPTYVSVDFQMVEVVALHVLIFFRNSKMSDLRVVKFCRSRGKYIPPSVLQFGIDLNRGPISFLNLGLGVFAAVKI